MSSPDTNIVKQTRRHRGPLIGMVICMIIVGTLFIVFSAAPPEDISEGAETTEEAVADQ